MMLVYLMILAIILMTVGTKLLNQKEATDTAGNMLHLPLNLQFFADDDGGSGEGDGDEGGDDNDDQGDDDNSDDPGDQGDGTDKKDKGKKSFTQEDVSKIAAKEAKKAQEKLLKELGVKDAKSAKEGLAKFKEMQDAQKTDAQKAIDKVKSLEDENGNHLSEVKILKAQVSAMKAGVNNDSLEDVIILANNLVDEDTTMDEAIAKVLEKYPNFKVATVADDTDKDKDEDGKKKKKPKFTDGNHDNKDKPSENAKWTEAFSWTESPK